MHNTWTIDKALKLLVGCVIFTLIADIAFVIAFFLYKASLGYGILQFGDRSITWSFLSTPTGAILATLGILPYGIALLGIRQAQSTREAEQTDAVNPSRRVTRAAYPPRVTRSGDH